VEEQTWNTKSMKNAEQMTKEKVPSHLRFVGSK